MTVESAKLIAASIIGTRLDYCNSLLYGSTAQNIDRLQRVQNTLVRIMLQKPCSASATELRRELHWLPISQRIEYKLAAITFKTKQSGLPGYLYDRLHDY